LAIAASGTVAFMLRTEPCFTVSALRVSIDYRRRCTMSDVEALDGAFFTGVLETNKDAVRAAVRDALLDGVKRQFQWELPDTVKKAVAEFVTEEIVPEIRAELEANKEAFVAAATQMAAGAAAEIAKAMQEQIAKNLTNSWTLRKVTEELFR
jgi:hypothetical protein